jgi:hypothetical protein
LVILSLLVVAIAPAHAQYIEMYRLDNIAKDLPEQEAIGKLATHLSVSADSLKQEKAEYKATFGELYFAHQVAKLSNSDIKSLMAELKSGKSWGELAKAKKIDLGQVRKDSRKLEDVLKKTQRASR